MIAGQLCYVFFFFNDTATTEIYTLSLHDALPILIMMKFVCLTTEKLGIKTIVSLNPIMVDGTGMCGACRVTVDGVTKFACVDGPEFDGHKVNFDEAMRRSAMYRAEEKEDNDALRSGCGLGGAK